MRKALTNSISLPISACVYVGVLVVPFVRMHTCWGCLGCKLSLWSESTALPYFLLWSIQVRCYLHCYTWHKNWQYELVAEDPAN
jgi:hypothetical protein